MCEFDIKNLWPDWNVVRSIGSVVEVKNIEKPVMIFGIYKNAVWII